MKPLLFLWLALGILVLCIVLFYSDLHPKPSLSPTRAKPTQSATANRFLIRLRSMAVAARRFAVQNNLSTERAFLLDMEMPSGKKRFFVYDLGRDSLLQAGLVSHGSCNTRFLEIPRFSNVPECGCSSLGRYKVGGIYNGRFGIAFKLHGLDSTNANAYARNVVLHGYDCVPEEESYPFPICNSLGCPMVSPQFMETLTAYIEESRRPVLLWMYN